MTHPLSTLGAAAALALCAALPARAAPVYQATVLPDVFHGLQLAGSASGAGSFAGTRLTQFAVPGRETGLRYVGGAVSSLAVPGYTDTALDAINRAGTAAGSAYNFTIDPSGPSVVYAGQQAVLWGSGAPTLLGTLGGSTSHATGINDAGTVVGNSWVAGDDHVEAFVWSGGTMRPLLAGGRASQATGVNNRGDVIGVIKAEGSPADAQLDLEFQQADGQPFIYRDGQLQLLDRRLGQARGEYARLEVINDQGAVMGNLVHQSVVSNGFVLRGGELTFLRALKLDPKTYAGEEGFAVADDMNDLGEVVGKSLEGLAVSRAVLWKDGEVVDLNDALSNGLPQGVWLSRAFGIDDASRILAVGTDNRIYHLTPVPEPSTFALCGLGLTAVGWAGTRRGRRAA